MTKQYMLYIYKVIKEHSDNDNPITISEIVNLLNDYPYELDIDRKTVSRAIDGLVLLDDFNICETFEDNSGNTVYRNGKELRQGVYYDITSEDITEEQLYFLIDCVLSAPHLTHADANETIQWLLKQAPKKFSKKYSSAKSEDYGYHTSERVTFTTIDAINNAAQNDCQIEFSYNDFDIRGRLAVKEEHVVVNPYYTVIRNGHYYLICSRDGENEFRHYRIDKISNVRTLVKNPRYPILAIKPDFDLNKYLQEHPYMFAGEVEPVRILIKRNCVSALYDYFGSEAFTVINDNDDDECIEVRIKTCVNGFYYWALQYGENIEVLEPQSLRDRIRNAVTGISNTYSVTDEDRYSKNISDINDQRFPHLSLFGIDLNGKTEHQNYTNITTLAIGDNNITDYSFVNNYTELIRLHVRGLECINHLNLNLPNLRDIRIFVPRGENGENVIPNLNFFSNCPNLMRISLSANVEDFSALYNLQELEMVELSERHLDRIDLTRFPAEAKVETTSYGAAIITFPTTIERHRSLRRR